MRNYGISNRTGLGNLNVNEQYKSYDVKKGGWYNDYKKTIS